MKKVLKNSVLVLLLWVFLFPLAFKSVHFHEHIFKCTAKTEKHLHQPHEKCFACDYEFSVFAAHKFIDQAYTHQPLDFYRNTYASVVAPNKNLLSFFLRAPPQII